MSRKDILGVSATLPTAHAPNDAHAPKTRTMPLLGVARKDRDPSAKLTANIGNALREQNDRVERAEEIERRLAEGQAVVDLDPKVIDPSFMQDRMPGEIDGLLASIKEQGQQVPILVRPHPQQPGRYEVAFGHRRLRAVSELGLPVKAVVRDLTDEQLVVAQGQENNERQDLTFIEKARFAARLKERFTRDVIISSMSVDKGDLSKMLSIVDALPSDLIDAIGSAPGVGLRSWQELAGLIEKASSAENSLKLVRSSEIQGLQSADRFKALMVHLKPRRTERGLPDVMASPNGERLAQVKQSKAKVEIMIDRKAAPDFAAFVLEQLPALYEAHRAKQKQKKEA
ncbi:plasmid partitioning protein RepB (plasmid) [Rhizobium sp. CB3090]|uniref:plasmid partitioning protein RepB n=1 Tax=Rhizobium sp. CB3090 TaxID=3039156 RepID=UPI0024B06327|nr:plasmid partitioning protein RepB [Rhizobium sp. CB3090]WFU13330.1 plasmid partitioning protein RepB [Rhizobium sp. CB3090]